MVPLVRPCKGDAVRIYLRRNVHDLCGWTDVEPDALEACAVCGRMFPMLKPCADTDLLDREATGAVWRTQSSGDIVMCPECDAATWTRELSLLSAGQRASMWSTGPQPHLCGWGGVPLVALDRTPVRGVTAIAAADRIGRWRVEAHRRLPWGGVTCMKE